MSTVEADVFGRLRSRLLGLEKQLPDHFVRRTEESLQGPRPFRIELPHAERPALAGKGSADEHHMDHVNEAGVLLYDAFDALLQLQRLVG